MGNTPGSDTDEPFYGGIDADEKKTIQDSDDDETFTTETKIGELGDDVPIELFNRIAGFNVVPTPLAYTSRPNLTNFQFITKFPPSKEEVPIISNIKISEDKKNMSFDIGGITFATALTLMRTIKTEVPIMAIDSVAFDTNTTGFHPEIISQRLGLIPLNLNPEDYNFRSAYPGNVPNKKTFEVLSLSVKNQTQHITFALSNDILTIKGKQVNTDKIRITPLIPGSELSLKAEVIKSIGRQHAKWSPGKAFYSHETSTDLTTHKEKILFHFKIESQSSLSAPAMVTKALKILSMPRAGIDNKVYQTLTKISNI